MTDFLSAFDRLAMRRAFGIQHAADAERHEMQRAMAEATGNDAAVAEATVLRDTAIAGLAYVTADYDRLLPEAIAEAEALGGELLIAPDGELLRRLPPDALAPVVVSNSDEADA